MRKSDGVINMFYVFLQPSSTFYFERQEEVGTCIKHALASYIFCEVSLKQQQKKWACL